jgi:hypothetical protein
MPINKKLGLHDALIQIYFWIGWESHCTINMQKISGA